MLRSTDNFTQSLDLGEDRSGGCGPHERSRREVVVAGVAFDAPDQVRHAGEAAAADCLLVSGFSQLFDVADSTEQALSRLRPKHAEGPADLQKAPKPAGRSAALAWSWYYVAPSECRPSSSTYIFTLSIRSSLGR